MKILGVSAVLLTITVLAIDYSQSDAETPKVYNKEIQIIPDKLNPKLFTFVGNACVDAKGGILNPKVMLYSDLEQKPLWLVNVFGSNECFGAVQKILANDPDSIEAKIIAYGDYSIIQDMEKKIEELKILQSEQQQELKVLSDEKFPKDFNLHIDKIRKVADRLFETQKSLQKETADYYNTMRYLHPSDMP
jgi:hypothetical protein